MPIFGADATYKKILTLVYIYIHIHIYNMHLYYTCMHTWHDIALHCICVCGRPSWSKCRRTQSYPSGLGLAIMAPTWPRAHCLDADGAWSRRKWGLAGQMFFGLEFWRRNGWWNILGPSRDLTFHGTIKKSDVTNLSMTNLGQMRFEPQQ